MVSHRANGKSLPDEGRECGWQTLSVLLMARRTDSAVNLFTFRHQLDLGPLFAHSFIDLAGFFLLACQPGVVFSSLYRANYDGHKAMLFAAQFSTLAAISTRRIHDCPGFMNKARYCVALDRKIRHPPGVQGVAGRHQKTYASIDRNDQLVVHIQQVMLALANLICDFFLRGQQGADKLHFLGRIVIQIGVLPFPLQTANLNVDFGITSIVHSRERGRRWDCHSDQNNDGHNGPKNLDFGVVVEIGGHCTQRLSMHQHRIDHHRKYHHTNHHADPKDQHMQVVYLTANIGNPLSHVHRPISVYNAAGQ